MRNTSDYAELANSRSTAIKCMKTATLNIPSCRQLELTAKGVFLKYYRRLFLVRIRAGTSYPGNRLGNRSLSPSKKSRQRSRHVSILINGRIPVSNI